MATDGQHVAATFSDGPVKVLESMGKLLREFTPEGLAPSGDVTEVGVRYLSGDVLLVWGRDAKCPVQLWKPDGSASLQVMPEGPTMPVHVEPSAVKTTSHDPWRSHSTGPHSTHTTRRQTSSSETSRRAPRRGNSTYPDRCAEPSPVEEP